MKNEYNSFKEKYGTTIIRITDSLNDHFCESFKYVKSQLPDRVYGNCGRPKNDVAYDRIDKNLMIMSKQVREELERSCNEVSIVARGMEAASASLNYEQYNLDTLIFGDLKMDETISRESIEIEMEGKKTLNEYIGHTVYDVENFIYITPTFVYDTNMVNFFRTYRMEYNALFIRYAAGLNDDDFKLLMDTLKVVITERVARLFINLPTLSKLLTNNDLVISDGSNVTDPTELYLILLIGKLVMDSLNGITSNNDNKSITNIIGLAKLSMRNTGLYDGVRRADMAIKTFLEIRLNEHPRLIENVMNTLVNETASKKFRMRITSPRRIKIGGKVDTWSIMKKVINGNMKEYGIENADLSPVYGSIMEVGEELAQYSDKIFTPYSVYGMENYEGDTLSKYKRKTRAELLGKISNNKKRKRYLTLESDVTRYKSDMLNCNEDVKKNVLLKRSETLSKLINIEVENSNGDDVLTELYVILEDMRFQLDGGLASRDFSRERNSKLYGQVKSGGVWDY